MANLVIAVTGASGAICSKLLVEKSPWPVTLVVSEWGKKVYEEECGSIKTLYDSVDTVYNVNDLTASISSGSVSTMGMVIVPGSCNTLGEIASGISNNLITRAAHCHLKERRKLIFCLRETPLSHIDLENSVKISQAGGIIMPIAPPFYMKKNYNSSKVIVEELMDSFCDRVLSLLGYDSGPNWEDVK